jgi:uncharacterized phage protein gp47/JayE
MTNSIDETGLVLESLTDIVAGLELGFKEIYGDQINVDANSPDGQMINIFAQAKIDMLDVISGVYNSFSPTSAIGSTLDQRCALNGVIRKGATRTTVQVTITTDRAVALVGLDTVGGIPFTVSDGTGNRFNLVTGLTTTTGVNTLLFSAEESGAVEIIENAIVNIDTVTLGVLSANNPGGAIIQGIDEETDAQLRFRRAQSVSNPSTGYLEGLTSALLAIEGVLYAVVFENNTSIVDANNIPGHSIWPIVDGGLNSAIADVIYRKRNAGCGMYYGTGPTGPTGTAQTESIVQINGTTINILFSRPTYYDLYIDLTVTSKQVGHSIDTNFIKNSIYENIVYGINEMADYSQIAAHVKTIDPLAVITEGAVGDGPLPTDSYIAPPSIDGRWIISTGKITVTVI